MSEPVLEVAANSVASALAAQAGGAARVELCSALELGGLTPSHAAIALAQERLGIPVHVLIRPRAGDFVFDDLECEEMQRDIEVCKSLGCAGLPTPDCWARWAARAWCWACWRPMAAWTYRVAAP